MVQILDAYGKPIQRAQLKEQQTTGLGALHREFASHPTRGLTPVRLARLLQRAEEGDLQAQADLFEDMEERDAHIFAEMQKRKNAILTLDWTITPPRNATREEQAATDWLAEVFADTPNLPQFLLDLMEGVGFGFSNIEIEWGRVGSELLPVSLDHRPAAWFKLAQGNQNELRLRDNSPEGAALRPFGWVRHVHQARNGYIARAGLHRVLAWPYLLKNYAVRDLAELLEICGIPIRLGKYPSGVGKEEKATLLRAVTQLGHAAAGIIPDSMSIDFVQASNGSHDPHEAMINWSERSVSKAVLGGTLTSQADGKSSTNALGKVHNEVRRDLIASDTRQVAATIMRDLFWPMLVLNRGGFNDARRVPHLMFDVEETEDLAKFSKSLPALVDIGVQVPERWARGKLGIPEAESGDAILQRQPKGQARQKQKDNAALSANVGGTRPAEHLAEALDAQAGEAWFATLLHIEKLVEEAQSMEALAAAIDQAYGSLPQEDLRKVTAQALAVAHLAGMSDVQDDD